MRFYLIGSLVASVWISVAAAAPNFLFVLVDDMGYGDLSCYGNQKVRTENIDRLASEGIRFTQFYVAAPVCSPSRCGFMTGQCPARWKVTSYLAARAENRRRGMRDWLDPQAPSLARILSQRGYLCGHVGKWHLGGQRDVGDAPLITEYGFDHTLTQFEGLGDRILSLCDAHDGTPIRKHVLGSDKLGRGNITYVDRAQTTAAFVTNALLFVQRAQAERKPFYLNLWPDDVHSPYFPPKELRGQGTKKELYQAVLKTMDAQLGPLFEYVRNQPELRSNTIVLLSSDNGPEPGSGEAGALRAFKGTLYEGGIREPLIVWAPGLMPAKARGTVNSNSVVSALDFVPSLARLAGVALPREIRFDGEDLSQTLLGRSRASRRKPLMWNRPPDWPGTEINRWPDLAIREGDWKLLVMEDGAGAQLYDLASDPSESRNVAREEPKVAERLKKKVLTWRNSMSITFTNQP